MNRFRERARKAKEQSGNKKIINAEAQTYDGIKFKSKLEVRCYKILKEAGIPFEYEKIKFVLQKGFYLTDSNVLYYCPKKEKLGNGLEFHARKFTDITYTPDFVVTTANTTILIDVKGYRNDVYLYKLKLLLNMLMKKNDGRRYVFYEPHTIAQMNGMVEDIKGYLKADE